MKIERVEEMFGKPMSFVKSRLYRAIKEFGPVAEVITPEAVGAPFLKPITERMLKMERVRKSLRKKALKAKKYLEEIVS